MIGAKCETMWLHRIKLKQMQPTTSCCDNQSVIKMTENLIYPPKPKDAEIHHHYIKKSAEQRDNTDLLRVPRASGKHLHQSAQQR